jgi:hypothetical protein
MTHYDLCLYDRHVSFPSRLYSVHALSSFDRYCATYTVLFCYSFYSTAMLYNICIWVKRSVTFNIRIVDSSIPPVVICSILFIFVVLQLPCSARILKTTEFWESEQEIKLHLRRNWKKIKFEECKLPFCLESFSSWDICRILKMKIFGTVVLYTLFYRGVKLGASSQGKKRNWRCLNRVVRIFVSKGKYVTEVHIRSVIICNFHQILLGYVSQMGNEKFVQ